MSSFCRVLLLLALAAVAPDAARAAEGSARAFAFVSPQYIVTAEVAGANRFIVNFINLSDFVTVVQPNEFIYKGASGRFYIGQVFDQETRDYRGETYRYSASILIKSRSFVGLTVIGFFAEVDTIEELSIRIGAKRYYLKPVDTLAFEQLAAAIPGIDLKNPSPRAALQAAYIPEMGTVRSTDGTSEWDRDWQGLLMADGINPPRIIEKPEIQLTEEAKRTQTYGKVRLSAIITKNGTVADLKVERGLGRGLDDRAVEAVRNSWVFLPATRNGEVLETSIKFDVEFPPPTAPRRP